MEYPFITHPSLGEIALHRNSRARHIIFRAKEGALTATLPLHASQEEVLRAADQHLPSLQRLLLKRPELRLTETEMIFTFAFPIILTPVTNSPLQGAMRAGALYISCPTTANGSVPPLIRKSLKRMISKHLFPEAERILPPMLREKTQELGLSYTALSITRGERQLGRCSSRGEIGLSYRLLLLPERLINYVIYHELAHLTHLNHSHAFHQLCNHYCHGKELELRRELRQFRSVL